MHNQIPQPGENRKHLFPRLKPKQQNQTKSNSPLSRFSSIINSDIDFSSSYLSGIKIGQIIPQIPVYLALAFTYSQIETSKLQEISSKNQKENDEYKAAVVYRYDVISKYSEYMTELLGKDVAGGKHSAGFKAVASFKTLSALNELDAYTSRYVSPDREDKGLILRLLVESKLITRHQEVVDLEDANLRYTMLVSYDLSHINLSRAWLSHVSFDSSNLSDTALKEANLYCANLRNVSFEKAEMEGAYLSFASFGGADLNEANLRGADLREADLKGAVNLNLAQIRAAKNWKRAHYDPEVRKQLGLPPEQLTKAESLPENRCIRSY